MRRLTFVALGIGCVLAATMIMNAKDASAVNMAQTLRHELGDKLLQPISLIDCSGCRTGGRCPNACSSERPPKSQPGGSSRNRNTHGCACLHNETRRAVNFRYRWGPADWKTVNMKPNFQYAFCWRYADDSRSSPTLRFELDVDMTKGSAWTTYDITRIQTPGNTCKAVPANAHYTVKYRPNSGNQFIAVYKRN